MDLGTPLLQPDNLVVVGLLGRTTVWPVVAQWVPKVTVQLVVTATKELVVRLELVVVVTQQQLVVVVTEQLAVVVTQQLLGVASHVFMGREVLQFVTVSKQLVLTAMVTIWCRTILMLRVM